jgi:hypothetical protein
MKPVENEVKMTENLKDKKSEHQDKNKIIKKLTEVNPRREGTKGFKSWELLKEGMTITDFILAGGRMADLLWDVKKKHLELI